MRSPFCIVLLIAIATSVLAQGPLTPPAAPAPTMKALDQIEARTIVDGTNTPGDEENTFIISQPGSYYLTGNITGESGKHGISVRADDVTLDLNGFALIGGGAGKFRGVNLPADQFNFCIRNGTVRGWTDGGVRADAGRNTLAERLRLSGNTGAVGIYVGLGSMIKDCVANQNGTGFRTADRCHVNNCVSTENTANGFESSSYVTIADCTASRNANAGIYTGGSCNIVRCSATRNKIGGIATAGSCTIADSTADSNPGSGIYVASFDNNGGVITGCSASYNTAYGISANGGSVTNCTANYNGEGISANYGSVTGSTARNNGSNGILASYGTVAQCTANENGASGIDATTGSVTNSTANFNVVHGVRVTDGVLAFCRAWGNSVLDFSAGGAVRTGNNPP